LRETPGQTRRIQEQEAAPEAIRGWLAEAAGAEPLMRRALAISEASFGAEHPNVATSLNNLAKLLHDSNRPAEAEPLGRRMLLILLAFTRDTGHRHPKLQTGFANYRFLLLTRASDPSDVRRPLDSLGADAGLDVALWQSLLAELLSGL
jgi:hypothetical protein